MSLIKKIGKKIIKTGLETVKEAGEQVGSTVSPDRVVAQITGQEKNTGPQKKKDSEFSDYLRDLGPNLTEEQLEEKIAEAKKAEQKGISAAKKVIRSAIPPHMRPPPRPKEPRPYEVTIQKQEEERKKAMEIEALKKKTEPIIVPKSDKKQPGLPPRGIPKKGKPEFRDFKIG